MRARAADHGVIRALRGTAGLLSIALTAVVVAAPMASAWHELTVQHVRCAEHGELTHIATPGVAVVDVARSLITVVTQEPGTGTTEGHDHCALGLVVRSGAGSSVVRTALRYVPPPAVTRTTPVPPLCPGRAFVLASAPKTSPPSA